MHVAGADFPGHRANGLSVGGWRPLFEASAERAHEVQPGLAEALGEELALLEERWPAALPEGAAAYYVNVTDERDLVVSSEHVELIP